LGHGDGDEAEAPEGSEEVFRGIYLAVTACRRSHLGDMMGLKNLSRNSHPDLDHPGYFPFMSGLTSGKGEKSNKLTWTADSSSEHQ
jgi:hypothetical protein